MGATRQIPLAPAVVQASVLAYNQAVETLGSDARREALPDIVRTELAAAIVQLAERGMQDPDRMKDVALARIMVRSRLKSICAL